MSRPSIRSKRSSATFGVKALRAVTRDLADALSAFRRIVAALRSVPSKRRGLRRDAQYPIG